MYNPTLARTNMVLSQVTPSVTVSRPLYDAMLSVPRHRFVPKHLQGIAYLDEHIPLGSGRYLMAPALFAALVDLAAISPNDTILDVGCTTGYSTSIFSQLAKKVIALESNPDLASTANYTLNSLQVDNVIVISNVLAKGHPEGAPYDVIFLNGAVEKAPDTLLAQLAEGGRLVTIIKQKNTYNNISNTVFGEITLFQKDKDIIAKRELWPVSSFLLEMEEEG